MIGMARVPAHVPHTFLNTGPEPFNLIAAFPDDSLSCRELGPNPLAARRAGPAEGR